VRLRSGCAVRLSKKKLWPDPLAREPGRKNRKDLQWLTTMSSKHNSLFRATPAKTQTQQKTQRNMGKAMQRMRDASQSASASSLRLHPLRRLTVPELQRRISLLERQAARYPELAEAPFGA
jgi:hypothetical protein